MDVLGSLSVVVGGAGFVVDSVIGGGGCSVVDSTPGLGVLGTPQSGNGSKPQSLQFFWPQAVQPSPPKGSYLGSAHLR